MGVVPHNDPMHRIRCVDEAELARYLCLTTASLRLLQEAKEDPISFVVAGVRLYRLEDVELWLDLIQDDLGGLDRVCRKK